MVRQCQVPQHHSTTADRAMRPNASAACNPNTPGHGRVGTHMDVVTDLDQVVELDTVFNDRVFKCTTVNAGVGTDFDVIANAHGPQLLDLDPLPLVRGKTKAIGANHNPCVHNAAGTDRTVFAHRDPGFEHRCSPHHGTALHHTLRPDAGIVCHDGLGIDHRTWMDARTADVSMVLFPELGETSEIEIGIVGKDRRCARLHLRFKGRIDDHTACGTLRQLGLVTCVAEETDLIWTRCLQRGQ